MKTILLFIAILISAQLMYGQTNDKPYYISPKQVYDAQWHRATMPLMGAGVTFTFGAALSIAHAKNGNMAFRYTSLGFYSLSGILLLTSGIQLTKTFMRLEKNKTMLEYGLLPSGAGVRMTFR